LRYKFVTTVSALSHNNRQGLRVGLELIFGCSGGGTTKVFGVIALNCSSDYNFEGYCPTGNMLSARPPYSELAPDYLQCLFTQRHVNDYNLRNLEGKLSLPKPNTNYLKRSFCYSGACLWNNLPQDLKIKRWFHWAVQMG